MKDVFDPEVFLLIAEHDDARRELLWLRAREKRDRSSIQCLRRGDPGLAGRMKDYEKAALEEPDPRARAQAFRDLQDETEEHWARILTGRKGNCRCGRCRAS